MKRAERAIIWVAAGVLVGGLLGNYGAKWPLLFAGESRRPNGEICGWIRDDDPDFEACRKDGARRQRTASVVGSLIGGALNGVIAYYGKGW